VLGHGPVAVSEIEDQARAAGLLGDGQRVSQSKPLRTARGDIGVRLRREGFGPGAICFWELPEAVVRSKFSAQLLGPLTLVAIGKVVEVWVKVHPLRAKLQEHCRVSPCPHEPDASRELARMRISRMMHPPARSKSPRRCLGLPLRDKVVRARLSVPSDE
jgi:hypothetical protein